MIAESAAVNPASAPSSPYRDQSGLPASLKMRRCLLRRSHDGCESDSSGREREGCQRHGCFGSGSDVDAASESRPSDDAPIGAAPSRPIS